MVLPPLRPPPLRPAHRLTESPLPYVTPLHPFIPAFCMPSSLSACYWRVADMSNASTLFKAASAAKEDLYNHAVTVAKRAMAHIGLNTTDSPTRQLHPLHNPTYVSSLHVGAVYLWRLRSQPQICGPRCLSAIRGVEGVQLEDLPDVLQRHEGSEGDLLQLREPFRVPSLVQDVADNA